MFSNQYGNETSEFLSTPSARRATFQNAERWAARGFLSTPSARRATLRQRHPVRFRINFYPRPPRGGRLAKFDEKTGLFEFLSTPSARRATLLSQVCENRVVISIHALREEGDVVIRIIAAWSMLFLSTPSARRATAKTETKSLFSYKLYNILHGFRRALIYNGSKNYPNHAK